MANPEHVSIVKQGTNALAVWQYKNPGVILDLSDADLHGGRLAEANLERADLTRADLHRADLHRAKLRGANLKRANLESANLQSADLQQANVSSANLSTANLRGALLERTNLTNTAAAAADFTEAILDGAIFDGAHLDAANLLDVIVSGSTSFEGASVKDTFMDRHALESLKDYGGLSRGDRMQMNIRDGVATLRNSYSGFWLWFHLLALAAFVFPYAWFVVSNWAIAKFKPETGAETVTLFEALGRFIWSGGVHWREGWHFNLLPFAAFLFLLAYNGLRGVLLWKTKSLELQQESSGLPALFSLSGRWGLTFRIAQVTFFVNLLVVLFHSAHFMMQRIPV